MKKDEKKDELQSRREFFKKAAKATLPVVGAAVLASLPLHEVQAQGCFGCSSSCYGQCNTHCGIGCSGGCNGSCGGCRAACMSSCSGQLY